MIVVVEGPDGSGKTTLCKMLAEEGEAKDLKIVTPHFGDVHDPGEAYAAVLESATGTHDLYVVDRFHFGELVYGFTRRTMPSFGLSLLDQFNDWMQDMIGRVIVLAPDYAICKERHFLRGDPFIPYTLKREIERFRHLAQLVQLDYPEMVTVRIAPMDLEQTRFLAETTIQEMLEERAERSMTWR